MRVTQQDIAKLAEVSQATVSRVMARDDRVDVAIRERVLQVIREHNYQPDVRARSLRQRRTHLIGLVLKRDPDDLQADPFFAQLVSGIISALAGTPWHLCVDVATDERRQAHVYDELLRSRRVDGLILVESEPSDERILRLQHDNFPFVLIGNPGDLAELHAVDNDNVTAGQLATRHLKEQGYDRIAYLGGPASLTVTRDREVGYSREVKREIVAYSDFGEAAAHRVARELMLSKDRPDAIVAMDDLLAMGVVRAIGELGLRLGRDVGVVGFNDSPVCQYVDGGLTSVSLELDTMVRWSIRRLLQIIEKQPIAGDRQLIVGSALRIRGSSRRGAVVNLR